MESNIEAVRPKFYPRLLKRKTAMEYTLEDLAIESG